MYNIMNNELITSNGSVNFADMAKVMGVATTPTNSGTEKKTSQLARVKVLRESIMGTQDVNGKKVKAEVVPAGSLCIRKTDGEEIYMSTLSLRPFMQRQSYQRFQSFSPKKSAETGKRGEYIKTILSDSLNNDLMDTSGGFNCGKPAGYIQDYSSLPEKTKAIYSQIKRQRHVFGIAIVKDATDANGSPVEDFEIPVLFETDQKVSFKNMGEPFNKLATMQHLPIQHLISFATEEKDKVSGGTYYVVTAKLDSKSIDITVDDQVTLQNFLDWISAFNTWVTDTYHTNSKDKMSGDDKELIDQFIDTDELEGV
jgi:hypothetical protein